jgi:hypothetical protein
LAIITADHDPPFNIETVGIATIVLSLAAVTLFSYFPLGERGRQDEQITATA